MSLKSSFLFVSSALTVVGFGTGTYFSIKSLVFADFWENKIFELEKNIEKLSDSDYENIESSTSFAQVQKVFEDILNWLKKIVGEERFESVFLKLLGYENLPKDLANKEISSSDTKSVENKIQELKNAMTDSDKQFYNKVKQLDKICQKVVEKFENFKKTKKTIIQE